jgi:ribA/ribD-fused uncharacterized protein
MIEFNGTEFKSVEHAYMSAKSYDPKWKEFCHVEENPGIVKRKSKEIQVRDDWEMVKVEIMRKCLHAKFTQEPFRSMLLATGTQYIQEGNYWHDTFWGVDITVDPPEGKNVLGTLIMDIRANLLSYDFL